MPANSDSTSATTSPPQATKAIPINSNSGTRPPPLAGSGGIMGWLGSMASPTSKTSAPFPTKTSAPQPEAVRSPVLSPTEAKLSRKDSSSLSHDEALNISRAGRSGGAPRTSESAIVDELSSPLTNNGPTPSPTTRPRSNSRYDKLGLIAAYSGGPSSF